MIPASDTQLGDVSTTTKDRELWNIIEKQRTIILELQKELNKVTLERDNLLLQQSNSTTTTTTTATTTATTNTNSAEEKALLLSPMPPPRSPFRKKEDDDRDEQKYLTPIRLLVKSINNNNSFVLSIIHAKTRKELWQITKLYTDLLSLDMAVHLNFAPIAILSLKKNNKLDFLFSNYTNSVEKKRQLIQEYLENTLGLLTKDPSVIYSFLIDKKLKKGYLTKRTMYGCKKYYFIMNHSQLVYFNTKQDQLSFGYIPLDKETRIGKQKQTEDSLIQHAFIIMSENLTSSYKYILCADSDTERDSWVKVLHHNQSKQQQQQQQQQQQRSRSSSDISLIQQQQPNTSSTSTLPTIRHKTYQRSSMDDLALLQFSEEASKYSVESLPNLEELTKKSVNRRTFWSRSKKSPSNSPPEDICSTSSSSSTTIATHPFQIFGVSLEEANRLTRISKNFELPAIVYRCIEYLESKDAIHEEGIYRQSGSSVQIQQLRTLFCEYGDVDLLKLPLQPDHHQVFDVNVVASLLKMWLRELPVNVLTFELLNDFITVIDEENKQTRIKKLGHLVSMLPLANYSLLRTLIAHLIHIVHHAEYNKMTLRNVGIVFAPTLSIPSGVFTLFMTDFEYIFWTRDKYPSPQPPQQLEPSTSADRIKYKYLKSEQVRSNRNSVTYKNNVPMNIMTLESKVNYRPSYDTVWDQPSLEQALSYV